MNDRIMSSQQVQTLKDHFGDKYGGFEQLCVDSDLKNIKPLVVEVPGMENSSDNDIRLIMGAVKKHGMW